MKTLKIIGMLGGWTFLIWLVILFAAHSIDQYQATQTAKQNVFAISVLERAKIDLKASDRECATIQGNLDCYDVPTEQEWADDILIAKYDEYLEQSEKQYQ